MLWKNAHNEEVISLNEKLKNIEDKMDRLQYSFEALLQHYKPEINMESLEDLLGVSPTNVNSGQK